MTESNAATGYPDISAAQAAFDAHYEEKEDTAAFIAYLEAQRSDFSSQRTQKAPYFAVVQSSGCRKSKLITHLKETNENYTVVYWSFGR